MTRTKYRISYIMVIMFLITACSSATASSPTSSQQPSDTSPPPVPTELPVADTDTASPPSTFSPTQTLITGNLVALPDNSCLYADETYRVYALMYQFAQYVPLDHNLRALACKFVKDNDQEGAKWWVVTPPVGIYTQLSMTGVGLGVLDNPAVNLNCSTCGDYSTFDDWELLSGKGSDPVINYTGLQSAAGVLEAGSLVYDGSGNPVLVPIQ